MSPRYRPVLRLPPEAVAAGQRGALVSEPAGYYEAARHATADYLRQLIRAAHDDHATVLRVTDVEALAEWLVPARATRREAS